MTTDEKAREIAWLTGQLRHAYAHLVNGTVGDLKDFADGLLAPAIRSLEAMPDALRSARREGIEEAAKVADEHRGWIEDGQIAAAIRALNEKAPTSGRDAGA